MQGIIKADWSEKKVVVIGLGVSNLALIKFLKNAGATLCGRDQKSREELGESIRELELLGIDLILGADYLSGLEQYDVVVISPGVPKSLAELQKVKSQNRLESEISLVFRYSQTPIYGITGSSGKTTTTTLVGEILKASGIPVHVGGNIGKPLITELNQMGLEDHVLLELSSFQLEDLHFSPRGSLITNIAENHLDVHLTMENYIDAKKNIYWHQKSQDFLILNYDDPLAKSMAAEAPGEVLYFSLTSEVDTGAYLAGDNLIYVQDGEETVFAKHSELALPGRHNVANFLAAAVFSHKLGATWEAVAEVGRNFSGVAHRLELVGQKCGVKYYNDSIATTPQRTLAALDSFSEPIILIAGGSDKGLSFAELAKAIHRKVKHLILLGNTASKIRQAVLALGDFRLNEVEDLGKAVALAQELAEAGDIVLLSPACASFDQYAGFSERGHHFRTLVHDVIESKKQEEIK